MRSQKMYGRNKILSDMAENLLADFTLEEILEMNDLTDLDVVEFLLENGHIDGLLGQTEAEE